MEETKNVTVQELDELCKKIAEQRAKCDVMDAALTEENKTLAAMQAKAVEYLDALGRTSYKSAHGTIGYREDTRWNLPANPEAWARLFHHFKEQGIYEGMVTVNSQKLNSYANTEQELAIKEGRGMEFYIPGLEQPKLYKKPTFRRG